MPKLVRATGWFRESIFPGVHVQAVYLPFDIESQDLRNTRKEICSHVTLKPRKDSDNRCDDGVELVAGEDHRVVVLMYQEWETPAHVVTLSNGVLSSAGNCRRKAE